MADRVRRQGSSILVDIRRRVLPKDIDAFTADLSRRLEEQATLPTPPDPTLPELPPASVVDSLTRENEALRARIRALETGGPSLDDGID